MKHMKRFMAISQTCAVSEVVADTTGCLDNSAEKFRSITITLPAFICIPVLWHDAKNGGSEPSAIILPVVNPAF